MGIPHINEINTLIPEKSSFVYLKSKYGSIMGIYSSIMAVVIASAATTFTRKKANVKSDI